MEKDEEEGTRKEKEKIFHVKNNKLVFHVILYINNLENILCPISVYKNYIYFCYLFFFFENKTLVIK